MEKPRGRAKRWYFRNGSANFALSACTHQSRLDGGGKRITTGLRLTIGMTSCSPFLEEHFPHRLWFRHFGHVWARASGSAATQLPHFWHFQPSSWEHIKEACLNSESAWGKWSWCSCSCRGNFLFHWRSPWLIWNRQSGGMPKHTATGKAPQCKRPLAAQQSMDKLAKDALVAVCFLFVPFQGDMRPHQNECFVWTLWKKVSRKGYLTCQQHRLVMSRQHACSSPIITDSRHT